VCNVHGVRAEFIAEGRRRADSADLKFRDGAYFIGKLLWAKGHQLLIDYLADEEVPEGQSRTRVDVYGEGEDRADVEAAAQKAGLGLRLLGGRDHADPAIASYKVFVNPSRTEVLSTTTAEALAMGKFVVIERHPSNAFFEQFTNTITYETPDEFRAALKRALASTPAPLTATESFALSWPGATARFIAEVKAAAEVTTPPRIGDEAAHMTHRQLSAWKGYVGDFLRGVVFESGPISRQRWLHMERKWQRCKDPAAVVQKSCEIWPPTKSQSWADRYGEGAKDSWTKVFTKKGDSKA